MISLNLVSQDLKKEIKLRRVYNIIKKADYILLIVFLITSIALLTAKIILQNNFNNIVEETSLVVVNSQNYNNKANEIQAKLNIILKIQKEFTPWSYLIENLVKEIPQNITLSYLKINSDDKTIRIKGVARFRADLLLFKQNLENSEAFAEVELPLENILSKENISFDITIKFNSEKLYKTLNGNS